MKGMLNMLKFKIYLNLSKYIGLIVHSVKICICPNIILPALLLITYISSLEKEFQLFEDLVKLLQGSLL